MVTASPMSSNPLLQVYVVLSPTELPVDEANPLFGLAGFTHRAINIKQLILYLARQKVWQVELVEELVEG